MKSVEDLANDLHAIKEEQQFIVTRERRHRDSTFALLSYLSRPSLTFTPKLISQFEL
jgi:hypothetical protein